MRDVIIVFTVSLYYLYPASPELSPALHMLSCLNILMMNLLHKKSGCRIFTYDIIFVANFSLQKWKNYITNLK